MVDRTPPPSPTLSRTLSARLLVGLATPLAAQERWRVDLEGGLAWAGRAEFAVPGDTGTPVDLAGTDPSPQLAPRVTLTSTPTSRWSFRLLAAPLKLDGQLVSDQPVLFPRLALDLELDALDAPQGRAEDVALKAEWALTDSLTASLGYRIVEGGADNEKVYTFALIHYAVAGLSDRF